ncbi:pre-rRNA-processing protein ESF2 isoform X2 [Carex littledalei]|uniref:Pre-rRNA-processing protein ESF2 isoform X2 n=1 Tax=Carex littledalei TaxID=544730 RepID=A0A833QWD9_9POAL|nr:pre-rRNA-processing protein ESF2 isoform X2 [Carex littledalei]
MEEEQIMGKKEETQVQKVKNKRKRLQSDSGDNSDKRGVCYLSRVPPHMNPSHIRQLLSSFGEIQRLYLVPEGQSTDTNHKQAAGFRGKRFCEGWVEFAKRSVAKRVAKVLNNEQIGGKKRSPFYYDIWNIKYLSKFKWDDLISEIASKNRLRQEKLNMEISAAKRERDFYLSKMEQSLAQKHIQERRRKKQKTEGEEGNSKAVPPKVSRIVTQNVPLRNGASGNEPNLPEGFVAEVAGLF